MTPINDDGNDDQHSSVATCWGLLYVSENVFQEISPIFFMKRNLPLNIYIFACNETLMLKNIRFIVVPIWVLKTFECCMRMIGCI